MCICTYLIRRRITWTLLASERLPGRARAPTCAKPPAPSLRFLTKAGAERSEDHAVHPARDEPPERRVDHQ